MTSVDSPAAAAPSRLARKLGTADAVVFGAESMLGSGILGALGPPRVRPAAD